MDPTEYQHKNPEDNRSLLVRNTYDQFGRLYLKTYYNTSNNNIPYNGTKKTWLYADKFIYSESAPSQTGNYTTYRYSSSNLGHGEPVRIVRIYKPDLSKPFIDEAEQGNFMSLYADVNLKSNLGQWWPKLQSNVGFVFDEDPFRLKANMIRNTQNIPYGNWNGSQSVNFGNNASIPIFQMNISNIDISMYGGNIYIRTFAVIETGVQFSPISFLEF